MAPKIVIGKECNISTDLEIGVSDELIIGDCVYIGKNVKIAGRGVRIGSYSFLEEDIIIGGGQHRNLNSYADIGKACLICKGTYINCAHKVVIGDEVGIGQNVHIFSHGAYLNVLEGYPGDVAPVTIGSHVWIPEKTSIYAGVVIGDNVVICPNSSVIKDIPSGSLAGGNPAKVIKAGVYPKKLTVEEKRKRINGLLKTYKTGLEDKGIKPSQCKFELKGLKLSLTWKGEVSKFDFESYAMAGDQNAVAEDLRDFLRRYGIRFFNGHPFRSILPIRFRKE